MIWYGTGYRPMQPIGTEGQEEIKRIITNTCARRARHNFRPGCLCHLSNTMFSVESMLHRKLTVSPQPNIFQCSQSTINITTVLAVARRMNSNIISNCAQVVDLSSIAAENASYHIGRNINPFASVRKCSKMTRVCHKWKY